jgi:diguanylate cyclase (GGDEF)-like protein
MNLKKEKSVKALILVNCINFKRINMSYGYKEGDYIIQKMANQLKSLEKNKCKVFKFNADRFIVLIEDVDSIDQVILYAKMIETMFIDDDFKPDLQIKMGIVEIEKVKQDVDDILKDAAIALNSINELQSYAVFDADMDKKIHREDQIEHEIKSSIQARDTERIYFHYQPIFDLNTMKIVACEALARLNTKHYGQVAPLEFIDIAEKKQLIVPLGEYLLNEACLMIHQLESEGLNEIKIAVNISGIQVMQDEFVVMVERMIKKHQIDPNQLELEITESVYMQDYESINRKLFHLRELGISISMDDFGTGFSSFYRLKEAYLDILKIDRYFVKSIGINQNDKLISQDIISIGHKYELKCVAEGIENSYQLDNLRKHHCDYGQGYYLSYPLDKDDVIALLHKNLRK